MNGIYKERISVTLNKHQLEVMDNYINSLDCFENRSQFIRYLINTFFYNDLREKLKDS